MIETIITAVVSAILGGGMATWLLQRWVSKKLDAAERRRENKAAANQKEWLALKNHRHALGRFLFWQAEELRRVQEAANCEPLNGHLKSAWDNFTQAETALKDFENEQASSLYRE